MFRNIASASKSRIRDISQKAFCYILRLHM